VGPWDKKLATLQIAIIIFIKLVGLTIEFQSLFGFQLKKFRIFLHISSMGSFEAML
jgi:hypothetical protein